MTSLYLINFLFLFDNLYSDKAISIKKVIPTTKDGMFSVPFFFLIKVDYIRYIVYNFSFVLFSKKFE